MPIDYAKARALRTAGRCYSYDEKTSALYALGIGLASDPLDRRELRFVYGKDMVTMPTMATVVAWGCDALAETGIDFAKVVQGEQRLTIHRPLPSAAEIVAGWQVDEIVDKGPGRGALIVHSFDLRLAETGEPLATLGRTTFARGDGGFGGPAVAGPEPHPIPERPCDRELEIPVQADQALIYMLSGDTNPLHVDPEVAEAAGFPVPILHGLCTYGIACRAVLSAYTGLDPTPLRQFDVRFSSPVYPGDTIRFRMWRDGAVVSFEADISSRDVVVLRNGKAVLDAP